MRLFASDETRDYFEKRKIEIKSEVEKMSDDEINICDFQEMVDYLYAKYEIVLIILFEDAINTKLDDVKVEKYNFFYGSLPYDKEYYLVDGVCISYEIPFDGDKELLWLQPTSQIWTSFEVEDFQSPDKENCGKIILEFKYSKQELEEKGDKMQEFVKKDFENRFKDYRTMIGYINKEAETFNSNLKNYAMRCLDERKKRATSLGFISQMLEIPLERNENSPNIKPLSLERVARKTYKKPEIKNRQIEYVISEDDYKNINRVILMCGGTMEKTARTYYRSHEEGLRDVLLASLNTHYNNVTGETFRKMGKTDILIEFDNKAAFVGECKIWHGVKAFGQAVQQILSYSTWRDTKVSLAIFNKENSAFLNILNKIDLWVRDNTKSFKKVQKNVWECKYYRKEIEAEISIYVLAFDLFIDKAQLPNFSNV